MPTDGRRPAGLHLRERKIRRTWRRFLGHLVLLVMSLHPSTSSALPASLRLTLMPEAEQCPPWYLPVRALGEAQSEDLTTGWADMHHLVLLRDLVGHGGHPPTNVARQVHAFLAPRWERMHHFLHTVRRTGPRNPNDVKGSGLHDIPPWTDISQPSPSLFQYLRWTMLAAWLERGADEMQIQSRSSEDDFKHPILRILETDRCASAHWIWSHPSARRLWVRATLEHCIGFPWGSTSHALPYGWENIWMADQNLQSNAADLHAAVLGASGKGPLALRAGALLGEAGLREVLAGALLEIHHHTTAEPWAATAVNHFMIQPRLIRQSGPKQWPLSLRRAALLSPYRELRIMAASSMQPDETGEALSENISVSSRPQTSEHASKDTPPRTRPMIG